MGCHVEVAGSCSAGYCLTPCFSRRCACAGGAATESCVPPLLHPTTARSIVAHVAVGVLHCSFRRPRSLSMNHLDRNLRVGALIVGCWFCRIVTLASARVIVAAQTACARDLGRQVLGCAFPRRVGVDVLVAS